MGSGKPYSGQDCSLARALEVVGERWTLLVLRDTLFGVRRFTDLRQRLDIPRAVLVERLTTLVDAGLLERRPYRTGRDEYLPTERATALWPAMLALLEWGERYCAAAGGRRRFYRHVSCGTDLDAEGRCPNCGHCPGPAEVETRQGPGALNLREDPVSVALREPHRLLTPLP
jgi:DNA-binding HxlR family transcriptional regulator